jgi:alpha-glucosidase
LTISNIQKEAIMALKMLFFACLAAFAAGSAKAAWEGTGRVAAVASQGNQITLRGRNTTTFITVLAPDLVRVRMIRASSAQTPDYSWSVVKTDWPDFPVKFSYEKNCVTITTAAMRTVVQFSPFGIAFFDPNGRLISRDAREPAWDGQRMRAWKWMPSDERYYGLGEKPGPLLKNGHSYVMWNTDPAGYNALTDPMYQSIPFFLALRQGRAYGIFFDNTYRSSFDMGAESPEYYSFGAEGGELNYYFFWGPDPKAVIRRYTELVGRTELPPLWSLGYIQSSIKYYPESTVRSVADNFRTRHIPCDGIFLDNIHMRDNRVFTWDTLRFHDPKHLISDLRAMGFRIIAITDPGVKVEKGYWVYEEGVKGGHFLLKRNGETYTGIIWPGVSVFPDFTLDKTRQWWATLFGQLLKDGISGFLADMNEPTIDAVPLDQGWVPAPLDSDVVFYDHGLKSPYNKSHNVYGMLMSRATRDAFRMFRPDERPFVITRATYAGGQRYAAQWTGDNLSTWEDLRASLRIVMSMGLSGLPFAGSDVGGFIGMPGPELYARWLQAGIFHPFFWTHTGDPEHALEPWSFGKEWEDINRKTIELRYRMLPYLYNAFYEAAQTGLPIMRPLLLDYPDDVTAMYAAPDKENNEFLFGDDILASPVVREGETERTVYLPKGVWFDFWTERRYIGPTTIKVGAPIERAPMFVRGGAIIPMRQAVEYTEQEPIDPLTFEIYPEGNSSRSYYEDDGIGYGYRKQAFLRERIDFYQNDKSMRVEISSREGSYLPPSRSIVFKIHAQENRPRRVEAGGEDLKMFSSVSSLNGNSSGAAYCPDTKTLWIKVADPEEAITIDIQK